VKLRAFQVYMYKGIRDSGRVEIAPLTVIVGKNESGKTSLLKALHKLNPYKPEPYLMDREWPRGHRKERSDKQVVCRAEFELSETELDELNALIAPPMTTNIIEVVRDYGGRLEVAFPADIAPERLHPNNVDQACQTWPEFTAPVGEDFTSAAERCRAEARRLANEGRFTELAALAPQHTAALQTARTTGNPEPQHSNENTYISAHVTKLGQLSKQLAALPSMRKSAHEYVVAHLPTFIYMDDYRAFRGTAFLDEVKGRKDAGRLTGEDETLLMIMELSGLTLEEEVRKTSERDREQRQYDLDDAGVTLTREIEGRWTQRQYEVRFGADGPQFFTFVRDATDAGLIRLEERSKGFQWFFSFDLMFMYESRGSFKNCVLLLDEPGLHLHPDAQQDLLKRLEKYATENTLVYTTHLPFMIDLRQPERIRVISETDTGVVITEDLTQSQPEGKLTLQAALGISGRTSYLVAQRNIVVEGADDYWLLTELSNILIRSGSTGLDEDVRISAAGGASEAAYIATFMIGQGLEVIVLLDSDTAGESARESLVKKWLTRYKSQPAHVLSLGPAAGETNREFAIEDLFPDDFYLKRVMTAYGRELKAAGVDTLSLQGKDSVAKRTERALNTHGIPFNKGRVAKLIRADLIRMANASSLPEETRSRAERLIQAIREILEPGTRTAVTSTARRERRKP
jgi:energy-coupling factor transporter ATP-binding protein EcfA2